MAALLHLQQYFLYAGDDPQFVKLFLSVKSVYKLTANSGERTGKLLPLFFTPFSVHK